MLVVGGVGAGLADRRFVGRPVRYDVRPTVDREGDGRCAGGRHCRLEPVRVASPHRRRRRPTGASRRRRTRSGRTVSAEASVLVAVLLVTGFLVNQSPRQAPPVITPGRTGVVTGQARRVSPLCWGHDVAAHGGDEHRHRPTPGPHRGAVASRCDHSTVRVRSETASLRRVPPHAQRRRELIAPRRCFPPPGTGGSRRACASTSSRTRLLRSPSGCPRVDGHGDRDRVHESLHPHLDEQPVVAGLLELGCGTSVGSRPCRPLAVPGDACAPPCRSWSGSQSRGRRCRDSCPARPVRPEACRSSPVPGGRCCPPPGSRVPPRRRCRRRPRWSGPAPARGSTPLARSSWLPSMRVVAVPALVTGHELRHDAVVTGLPAG